LSRSYPLKSRKKEAILNALNSVDEPITPKEIAFRADLNHSTVRVYLRELVKEGRIKRVFHGHYVKILTPRVEEEPPRIHNLVLHLDAPTLSKGVKPFVKCYGDVKIQVLFGCKRRKITGYMSCDAGLDYNGCVLAIEKFKDIVQAQAGLEASDQDIKVKNCHFNQDFQAIRLDGLTCISVRSFLGSLERIYNKGSGIRSEVQVKPDSLESIYMLLKGGVYSYNITEELLRMNDKLNNLTEAIKFQNEGLQKIEDILMKLLGKMDRFFELEIDSMKYGLGGYYQSIPPGSRFYALDVAP